MRPARPALWMLAAFVVVGGAAAAIWREYWSVSLADLDPLLAACWIGMAALALHDVRPARDGTLAFVALLGGALIESWGTRAGLWTYFNGDEPPLFILPAWPAAALATERVGRALLSRVPRGRPRVWRAVYAVVALVFVVLLAGWTRRAFGHPLTWIAGACVAITCLAGSDRRADLVWLLAGSLIGYPLELWGTTSGCWVYASGGTPPFVAVLSHGFATVAFARGVSLVITLASRRTAPDPASLPARPASTASAGTPPAPST